MGQEIFYCGTCKSLLKTRDLEKGDAVRFQDFVYCRACAPAQAPSTPRRQTDTTRFRMSPTPRTPRPAAVAAARSATPMILAGVGGGVLVLVLMAFALSGGAKPPPRPEPEKVVAPPPVVVAKPERPPPRIVEPRPKPPNREAEARKRLEEARAFLSANPEDLDGAFERTRRARLEAEGTPAEADARSLDDDVRARLRKRSEAKWAAVDARVKAAVAAEKYAEAVAILETERTPDAAARVAETLRAAEEAWAGQKEKLHAARRKGNEAEAQAVAARVRSWGLEPILTELGTLLSMPVEVEPPPEVLAWRKRLGELAPPLDCAALLKDLEKQPGADKADLEVFRLAAELQREIPLAASRLKAGTELKAERTTETGERAEVAGRVLRATSHAIELLAGDERISLPIFEISPAGWCELLKAKPEAAQAFRALEGDAGPGPLPPNIAALSARLAREARSPAELAARALFAEAELDFGSPETRLAAGPKYQAIEKETLFARRAKGLIEERIREAQETWLSVHELGMHGPFQLTEQLKGTSTLTLSADSREASVDVEAELGESTRGWVYAGACCQETLALRLESPGQPPVPLKASSFLRARHTHAGRELRWSWIALPLPKFSAPGRRSFRIAAEREGLSIAYVWLSTGRPGPPREAELKAFEKERVVDLVPAPAGSLWREVWTGLPGDKIVPLSGPPRSAGPIGAFEGPKNAGDDYAARVRGYLHPPADGDYVFYLKSDNHAELWISADDTPGKKRRVAFTERPAVPLEWERGVKSAPVPLRAGRRFYAELLHKEGSGDDGFAVGWKLPDGSMERPIPGSRLSPYAGDGRRERSTFYRAVNLNGPALVIDGRGWEGKDAADLSFSGASFENQGIALRPPVDGPKAQMLRSSVWNRDGLTVTVGGVPPGRYLVYVYTWEDTTRQTFDVLLNGRVMKEKHDSGEAGQWARLGPWPADVADGKIELRTTSGDGNVSGIEIWRQK